MNARALLVSRDGALRPPWRIIAFILIGFLCAIVASGLVAPLVASLFDVIGARGVSTESWVALATALAATAICVRSIDKRSWATVWLDRPAANPALIGRAFLLGAACIGIPVAVLVLTGWLGREPGGNASSWLAAMARTTLVLLPAAFMEELVTRGYVFSVLREWLGSAWAVAVTSLGFGLLHLANPGATAWSVTLVTLAGVFLAAVLLATRSLYAAWAAHFAWNWVLAAVFHTAVSGYPFETPGYRYVDAGPDWATGGVWGPEGGLPAALGMLAGIALLMRRRRLPAHDNTSDSGNA